MTFGERLKALRDNTGISQQQLADRAGMHKMGVVKLERDERRPTWETVQALARALGVDCTAFADEQAVSHQPASADEASVKKPGKRRKA